MPPEITPQLNSIIGGRGSGKSTVLEYLRWCLCDQTDSFGSGTVENDVETRRANLIEKTLSSVGGEVRVIFNVNGTRHVSKRNPKSEDILLKIGDGEFQSVRPSQIRSLLPIQAYSQKRLSSVSIKSVELKRLIEQPVSEKIGHLDDETAKAINETIAVYTKLSEHRILSRDIQKIEIESESYKQQIEKMRSELKGLSNDGKNTLNRAELYSNEKKELVKSILITKGSSLVGRTAGFSFAKCPSESGWLSSRH
ncbi:MAG: ATP-binding protein [Candidatus Nitrotoga sp.]